MREDAEYTFFLSNQPVRCLVSNPCYLLQHAPIRPQNLPVNPSAIWPSQKGDYVGNVFNLSKSFKRIQLAQVIDLLRCLAG